MSWNIRLAPSLFTVACATALAAPQELPSARPALTSPVYGPVAANDLLQVPLAPPPACDGGRHDIEDVVRATSRELAARHILYASDELADCSGMVHRVLARVQARCDDVIAPDVLEARSARAMAAWYAERGQLMTILDPLDADEALVPGAIAFYGPPGRIDPELDDIFHIGVVFDVSRDAVGRVDSYRLFQGRRPGKVAGITSWHHRATDPPLGNGNEVLVAVAWPSPDVTPLDVAPAVADAPWDEILAQP